MISIYYVWFVLVCSSLMSFVDDDELRLHIARGLAVGALVVCLWNEVSA